MLSKDKSDISNVDMKKSSMVNIIVNKEYTDSKFKIDNVKSYSISRIYEENHIDIKNASIHLDTLIGIVSGEYDSGIYLEVNIFKDFSASDGDYKIISLTLNNASLESYNTGTEDSKNKNLNPYTSIDNSGLVYADFEFKFDTMSVKEKDI